VVYITDKQGLSGMVPCTCGPRTLTLKQENQEFEANLGYTVRPCLKTKRKEKKKKKIEASYYFKYAASVL
jgi:hypothetical protein